MQLRSTSLLFILLVTGTLCVLWTSQADAEDKRPSEKEYFICVKWPPTLHAYATCSDPMEKTIDIYSLFGDRSVYCERELGWTGDVSLPAIWNCAELRKRIWESCGRVFTFGDPACDVPLPGQTSIENENDREYGNEAYRGRNEDNYPRRDEGDYHRGDEEAYRGRGESNYRRRDEEGYHNRDEDASTTDQEYYSPAE